MAERVASLQIERGKVYKTDKISLSLVFLLIANFGSVLSVVFPRIIWIAVLLLSFLQIFRGRFRTSSKMLFTLLFIWFIAFISAIVTSTAISFYFGVLIGATLAFFVICCNENYESIKEYIYKSCKLIAILALINVALRFLIPGVFTFYQSQTDYTVHTLYFIFNFQTGDIFRNQGLYWEPGVLQIIMNLYLYLVLIEKNAPYKKAVLPILIIISTLSSTGLVIMCVTLFISLKKKHVRISFKAGALTVVACLLLAPFVYLNVRDKLTSDENPSAALRAYDMYNGFLIIRDNPICGVGMDPNQFYLKSKGKDVFGYDTSSLNLEDRGNTNTWISIAMMFGIPVLILFVVSLYHQRLFNNKKLFFFIIFMALFSEPLFPYPFLMLLILSYNSLPQKKLIVYKKSE